jgi:hypothetical protein
MMTRAALIQEKVQQRRIDAGLRGRIKPGVLQSSLALLRSRTSGAAGVTQHARSFASDVGLRRTLRDADRTYLRPRKEFRGQHARRVETSC